MYGELPKASANFIDFLTTSGYSDEATARLGMCGHYTGASAGSGEFSTTP